MTKYLFLSIFMVVSCSSQEFKNPYQAPFDGKKFENLEPFPAKSFFALLKWKLFKNDHKEWPDWIDLPLGERPKQRTAKGEIIYTVINHATVLV